MNTTKVVAISGASGASKTSVVKQLSAAFNCPTLFFDDHTQNNTYPKEMKTWLENGANVSDIKTPKLVESLRKLKSQSNSKYIFVEEPFGKQRDSISSLVDYVVLLDLPLEICLARIIKRNIANYMNQSDRSIDSISSYLDKYEDHLRDVYFEAVDQVRQNCDFLITKVSSIEVTAKSISNWLKVMQTDNEIII